MTTFNCDKCRNKPICVISKDATEVAERVRRDNYYDTPKGLMLMCQYFVPEIFSAVPGVSSNSVEE